MERFIVRLLGINVNLTKQDLLEEFFKNDLQIKHLFLADDGTTANYGYGYVEFYNKEDYEKFMGVYKLYKYDKVYCDVLYNSTSGSM